MGVGQDEEEGGREAAGETVVSVCCCVLLPCLGFHSALIPPDSFVVEETLPPFGLTAVISALQTTK